MPPRRFVAVWIACVAGALLAAAALNWAVDPYGVFGTQLPGLGRDKPAAIGQPFLSKVYLLERSKPTTLLIGSSRVDVGLNPESPAWPGDGRPVFNLGVPGAGLGTQALLLRHALTVVHPRRVVIGVGLDDCLVMPARPGASASAVSAASPEIGRLSLTRTGQPNPDRWRARFDDVVTALFSISALTDSLTTLRHLGVASQASVSPNGFNNGMDLAEAAQAEGPNALFVAKDRDKIASLLPWSRQQAFDIGPLADMFSAASAQGIDMVVFIYPNSGDDAEIYRRLGAEGTFDNWRASLVQAVAQARDDGAHITLFDFSGFTPYQTETVSPPGSRTQQKWFWETNHFKSALGELVIARIAGQGDTSFGVLLDASNLAVVQARFDAQRQVFIEAHPEVVRRIDGLYRLEHQRLCTAAPSSCGRPLASAAP